MKVFIYKYFIDIFEYWMCYFLYICTYDCNIYASLHINEFMCLFLFGMCIDASVTWMWIFRCLWNWTWVYLRLSFCKFPDMKSSVMDTFFFLSFFFSFFFLFFFFFFFFFVVRLKCQRTLIFRYFFVILSEMTSFFRWHSKEPGHK